MIEQMARAVENACVVVACITKGYSESKHCRSGKVDSFEPKSFVKTYILHTFSPTLTVRRAGTL